MARKIGLLALVVLAALQFVPVDRSNPPVRSDLDAPAAVKDILRRSCYDCHSNETTWPWYSRVAPMSLLVAHDVEEGRHELNFSEWGAYDQAKRAHLSGEIMEAIEKGKMPLPMYVLIHGDAKLSGSELQTLRAWNP